MKAKTTNLSDDLADDVSKIAKANRTSESKVIELAVERLVAEIRETGRLPLPAVDLTPVPAGN